MTFLKSLKLLRFPGKIYFEIQGPLNVMEEKKCYWRSIKKKLVLATKFNDFFFEGVKPLHFPGELNFKIQAHSRNSRSAANPETWVWTLLLYPSNALYSFIRFSDFR